MASLVIQDIGLLSPKGVGHHGKVDDDSALLSFYVGFRGADHVVTFATLNPNWWALGVRNLLGIWASDAGLPKYLELKPWAPTTYYLPCMYP